MSDKIVRDSNQYTQKNIHRVGKTLVFEICFAQQPVCLKVLWECLENMLSLSNALISTVMTIIVSAGITLIAIRLYSREQIVIRES